ncbi:polysaccharide deacetylase family protein [Abditibacterium utsteinense]|nr:polysaccharide deacetylase family protein [Abditibacterium utsteinense]
MPAPVGTTNAWPIPLAAQGQLFNNVAVSSSNKIIALTFDDGPWPTYTTQILSVLAQYGVKATFFQVGSQLQTYPDLGRAARNAGHAIGNHTWSHQEAPADPLGEVQRADDIIQSVYGGPTGIFRPPYGNLNNGVASVALNQKKAVIIWNCDPNDWATPGTSVIVDRVVSGATPGGIVLMHDGGGDRSQTVAALPTIITTLAAQGYRFVTVPELLAQNSSAPTVSINAPGIAYSYSALAQVSGSAAPSSGSDLQSVGSLLFRYSDSTYWNGTAWTTVLSENLAQGTTTWSFALPSLVGGQYATQAVARSSSGSGTFTPWRDFFIDLIAPTLAVTTPKASTTYPTLATATGTASDAVGVKNVRVTLFRQSDSNYWNGTLWTPNYSVFPAQGKENWSASLPPLSNGTYSFEASARDYVDNTTYSGYKAFTINSAAPSVTTN